MASGPVGAGDVGRRRYDVAIVGGGIIGLATAFWCSRAGLSTIVIEQRERMADLTSARSGGGVRAQWLMPANIAMMREALSLYRDFAAVSRVSGFDLGFEAGGYLYATTTEAGAAGLVERAERQVEVGLDGLEILDGARLRAAFPHLTPHARLGLVRRADGWLDVERLVAGYRDGGRFDVLPGTTVDGLVETGGHVSGLRMAQERVEAGAVVLAPGPYARDLAAGLAGLDLPLSLVRGQLALVRLHGGMPTGLPATIDVDTGAFWRPDGQGARITAPLGTPMVGDTVIESADADVGYVARALDGAARLSPFWTSLTAQLDPTTTRAVAGQYCVSPDGAPVIGPAPGRPGLWLNLAYGGHGIMGSIVGGRHLARLLTGETRHEPEGPFAPERLRDPASLVPDPMTLNTLSRCGLSDTHAPAPQGTAHAP